MCQLKGQFDYLGLIYITFCLSGFILVACPNTSISSQFETLSSLFLIFDEMGFHILYVKGCQERDSFSLLRSLRWRSCLFLYLLTAKRFALNSSHLAFLEQCVLQEHKYPRSIDILSHRQRYGLASAVGKVSLAVPLNCASPVWFEFCINSVW